MTVCVAFLISCREGGAPVDNPDEGKDTVISEVTVTVPVSSTISNNSILLIPSVCSNA